MNRWPCPFWKKEKKESSSIRKETVPPGPRERRAVEKHFTKPGSVLAPAKKIGGRNLLRGEKGGRRKKPTT